MTEKDGYCLHGAKHEFQPRYDEVEPKVTDTKAFFGTFTEIAKDRIYVHDVCVLCGKTIQRSPRRD